MSSTESETEADEYIGARVSEDLKRDVRVKAAKENTTVSDYIKKLIREDLGSK